MTLDCESYKYIGADNSLPISRVKVEDVEAAGGTEQGELGGCGR